MGNRLSIRAVIFDFGSVLVQMSDEAPRQALADRLGVPLQELNRLVFDSETAWRAMLGELTIGQHWQAVGAALGILQDEIPAFKAQFWSADQVNEELVELIHRLRTNYKIGLLSNAWDDLRQVLKTRLPIGHLFDDLVISAEVGLGKPDPRIYLLATQRLGVAPGEAIFIDDVLANVDAARAAGLNAVHYQNNPQLLADLKLYNIP